MPLSNNFYGTIEGRNIAADFSQLNWYAQKTEPVKRIMNKIWEKAKFNPWYNALQLIQVLAEEHDLSPENFVLTNSSAEAVYLIAQAYRTAQTTIFIPTRNEYEAACKANKHYLNFALKDKLSQPQSLPGGLAFISHPNNLDGSLLESDILEKLLTHNANTFIVIDQTYVNYVPAAPRLNYLLKTYNNLIILESISQNYGFPGLPLGYVAGDKEIIEHLWSFKPPHSYNAISIETAKYVLSHKTEFEIPAEKFIQEKYALQEKLKEIPNLEILESKAPFFMVKLLKGTADELCRFLWKNYSVIVRNITKHRGISDETIRLIARENKENFLLLKGLRDYLTNQ